MTRLLVLLLIALSLAPVSAQAPRPATAPRPAAAAAAAPAPDPLDLATIGRIRTEAIQRSQAMDHVWWLSEVYGPRATATPLPPSPASA